MENFTWVYNVTDSTPSVFERANEHTLLLVARWLDDYSTYILTAIALVLNSAAFGTICTLRPLTSTSIYIATLAVVDTLCLVLKLMTTRLVRVTTIPAEISCGLLLCLFFFVQFMSSFLIVTISVERFVAVWFPFKVSRVFTKQAAMYSLLGLSLGILPLSVWTFWFYERFNSKAYGLVCMPKEEYDDAVQVLRKVHPMVYIIVPFVVVLILNVVIIIGLQKSDTWNMVTGSESTRRCRTGRRLSVMLVVTSISFLVLELPMVCIGMAKYLQENDTRSNFVKEVFYLEFAQTMEDINHTINFILYFLAGSKFRKWFLSMLPFRKCRETTSPDYVHTPLSSIRDIDRHDNGNPSFLHTTATVKFNEEKL